MRRSHGQGTVRDHGKPNPTSVTRRYEEQVYNAMESINSNQLGNFLRILWMKAQSTGSSLDYEKYIAMVARPTHFGTPKQRGGERIYFNPSDFHQAVQMRYSSDDVLFTTSHAYRDGEIGYSKTNSKHLNKAMLPITTEAGVLALQMQNIYLARRRSASLLFPAPVISKTEHMTFSKLPNAECISLFLRMSIGGTGYTSGTSGRCFQSLARPR